MPISNEPVPYLFACVDPNTGALVFGPIAHGGRAVEFARNTDTVPVRWPVEQLATSRDPDFPEADWRHVR